MDTHIPGALAAGSPTIDLRSYADHASMMRESGEITRIAPALVRAQAAIENPPRNKSVQVRTQAGAYQFRYATLDRITDMVRPALAENGLCVLQPIVGTDKGPALVTRLLHESGQWMECEVLLPALGNNPQGFGSAVTYLRRYSISSMLNITADEDDDGNGAAGNHVRDLVPVKGRARQNGNEGGGTPVRDPRGSGPRDDRGNDPKAGSAASGHAAEGTVRALVNQARVAETIEEGHALLEAWKRDDAALDALRGTRAWEGLERELGAGLKRSLGTDPAAAFVASLRATTAEHVKALQGHWEGRWADTLTAMQQEAPGTYALLRRHTAAQVARVRGTPGEIAEDQPGFEAVLRDKTGEVASDPMDDPVAFARAYADQWRATDEDARSQLARHNIKALAAAAKAAAARAVLDMLDTAQNQARAGTQARGTGATPRDAQRRQGRTETRTAKPKDEKAPASFWTILRPGKTEITAPDAAAWLAWWKDCAAKAAREEKLEEFQALYEANVPAWDAIAERSAEASDVVAEAGKTVREALEQ